MAGYDQIRMRFDHKFTLGNLSAYLDGALTSAEKARVERHLAVCRTCQSDLATLRETVGMLRRVPQRPVPRSFTLPLSVQTDRLRERRWGQAYSFLRTSAVAVSLMLVVLLSGDALFRSGIISIPDQAAQHSVAVSGPAVGLQKEKAGEAEAPATVQVAADDSTESTEEPRSLAAPAQSPVPAAGTAAAEVSAVGAQPAETPPSGETVSGAGTSLATETQPAETPSVAEAAPAAATTSQPTVAGALQAPPENSAASGMGGGGSGATPEQTEGPAVVTAGSRLPTMPKSFGIKAATSGASSTPEGAGVAAKAAAAVETVPPPEAASATAAASPREAEAPETARAADSREVHGQATAQEAAPPERAAAGLAPSSTAEQVAKLEQNTSAAPTSEAVSIQAETEAAPEGASSPAALSPLWVIWRVARLLAVALVGLLLVLFAGLLWVGQKRRSSG